MPRRPAAPARPRRPIEDWEAEELRAEITQLRAERSMLRARVASLERERAAQERLVRFAQDTLQALTPLPALPKRFTPRAPTARPAHTRESVVLGCACWHIGETVSKTEMGGINEYDFDVFCRRLQHMVDTVIDVTQRKLTGYTFDELHILHCGDVVSGTIHDELTETACLDIVEQATLGAFVTAQALRELAAVFPKIVVTGVVGNHGRMRRRPYFKGKARINWDYVFYQYLACLLRAHRSIVFHTPLSFFAGVQIRGHNVHVSHGDTIRSSYTIPFYGIERETQRWVAIGAAQGKFWRYFVRAHFHTDGSLQSNTGGDTILVASLKGGDEYALAGFGHKEPRQILFGMHAEKGKTWEFPLYFPPADIPARSRYVYDRSRPLSEQLAEGSVP